MTKFISIVGARDCPVNILETLGKIATFFARKDYTLRSGGDIGFDESGRVAFNKLAAPIELYLPWQGFNGKRGILWSQENWDVTKDYVPHWDELKLNDRIFNVRTVALLLGLDNNAKSDLLVCWTPNDEAIGEAATALKCARENKIPVYNLGSKTGLTKLRKFCKTL